MPHASTREALSWLASESGRSVESHRKELVEQLNDARRLFYSLNNRIRLDFHIDACFSVKEFYEPCLTCGCEPEVYYGITLPQEMEQVESVWIGTTPVTIYNRWLQYRDGIQGKGSSVKAIDVGNDFPIQSEWHPNKCIKPVFMASNQADCGKVITVTFTNANNEERRETLKLATTGVSTTSEVRSLKRPGGIVLPADLAGGIEVYDCMGGQHLGFFHPKVDVPAFRRLKLTGVCCGSIVHVHATRRFTNVEFDWEVIETDNKLAIMEAMRYLKIMAVNSSDAQWIAKARMHMDNMITYLGGDNLRDEGPATVRQLDFIRMPVKRSGLRSRKKYHIR